MSTDVLVDDIEVVRGINATLWRGSAAGVAEHAVWWEPTHGDMKLNVGSSGFHYSRI